MALEIKLCEWKKVANRDLEMGKLFPKRTNVMPNDSSCFRCEGYDTRCMFYIDKFTRRNKIPY